MSIDKIKKMTAQQNNKFQNKILKTISKCSHNQEINLDSGHYRHYHHHHHRITDINDIGSPPLLPPPSPQHVSALPSPPPSSLTNNSLIISSSNFLPSLSKFNNNKQLNKRKITTTSSRRNMLQLNSNLFFGLAIFFVIVNVGNSGESVGRGSGTVTSSGSESLTSQQMREHSNLTRYVENIGPISKSSKRDSGSSTNNNVISDDGEHNELLFDGYESFYDINNNAHRFESRKQPMYQNEFAVYIPTGDLTADAIAAKHGFINMGPVSEHLFIFIKIFREKMKLLFHENKKKKKRLKY